MCQIDYTEIRKKVLEVGIPRGAYKGTNISVAQSCKICE